MRQNTGMANHRRMPEGSVFRDGRGAASRASIVFANNDVQPAPHHAHIPSRYPHGMSETPALPEHPRNPAPGLRAILRHCRQNQVFFASLPAHIKQMLSLLTYTRGICNDEQNSASAANTTIALDTTHRPDRTFAQRADHDERHCALRCDLA